MTDALSNVPTLAKVLGSLALILLVNRLARNLLASVLAGTAVLALWSGAPAGALAEAAWKRVSDPATLGLVGAIFLVIWLSGQMAAAGVMTDLVHAVRARASKRHAMAILPAVIGMLPMPGGAIFSAPMVDRADADGTVRPLLKAQTNYWFRHIWEYWWPLYPGVMLAISVTGLEIWQFMLLQVPLTLFSLAAGYVFLLRRIPHASGPAPEASDGDAGAAARPGLVRLVLPIAVVIGTYAVVEGGWWAARRRWPDLPALNTYAPMILGLVLAVAVQQWQRPLTWRAWRRIVFSRRTAMMVLLVVVLRVYGALIEAPLPGGGSMVDAMRGDMDRWGIPVLGMIMLLPLVAGLTTGICIGFVGASFPIVVSLMTPGAPAAELLAAVTLAFGFGYMGMMLSPVHLCLIVTNEHFRVGLLSSLRGLARPAAVVLALVTAYHVAIRLIGG